MTVSSKERAWEEANKMFPTDYDKDYESSEKAGYPIYRHHELNYYNRICDLGSRLEIIVNDVVTNIWIEEDTQEEANSNQINEMVQAGYAAKELGESISTLVEIESYQKIMLCIDGSSRNRNDTERKVYDGLKRNETWLASDLVASYCDNHNIKWGVIEVINITHYNHGEKGVNGGHFIVTAYIGKSVKLD